jgi:hypothetical protein
MRSDNQAEDIKERLLKAQTKQDLTLIRKNILVVVIGFGRIS